MSRENRSGFDLEIVLCLVFMILKLTGTIDWSWWWVFAPLWIMLILNVIVIMIKELYD